MDQPDGKRGATPPIAPAVHVTRLSKQQARMRLWQAKSAQAGTNKTGSVGKPRQRKPSMPPTPWDDAK